MISKGLATILAVAVLAQVARGLPASQWSSFKESLSGVNTGGVYYAAAGLGGSLGGNSNSGGLFASAGTPQGQAAGAELGGSLGGNDNPLEGYLGAFAKSPGK